MNNLESALAKAIKSSIKTGQTLYVYATYYKICIATRRPPFGAAHWRVNGGTIERFEDDYQASKADMLS